jgi:hypothetical protein
MAGLSNEEVELKMRWIPGRIWIAGLMAMTAPLASAAVDIVAQRAYLVGPGNIEISSPAPGQTVFFALAYQITGSGSPVRVSYRALLDGVQFCASSGSPTSVPSNSMTLTCSQGWVPTVGGHLVTWNLDYTGSVTESAEYNNSASVAFTVTTPGAGPTLDIVAERAYVTTTSSQFGFVEVPSPTPGQTVALFIDMKVTGTGSFGGIPLKALLDGVPLMAMTMPTVFHAPFEGPVLGFSWSATPGTHKLEWDLNYDHSVAETDGSNNTAVKVFTVASPGGASNLARGRTATQSSTLPYTGGAYAATTTVAGSAVDGGTDGILPDGSVTSTNLDNNAWWQADLGVSTAIGPIVIWNRTDCCGTRLSDYWVFVSDTPFLATDMPATLQNRAGTFSSHQTTAPDPSTMITVNTHGQYVRVQLTGANYLSLAEVQVFGQLGLTVSHIGSFMQGQPMATYSLSVQDVSGAASGTVSVSDTLLGGLTAPSMGGPGWTCTLGTPSSTGTVSSSCSRSDPLPAGGSYPPITVTASVAGDGTSYATHLTSLLSGGLRSDSTIDNITVQAPFTDVGSTDSFLPAIDLLKEYGITSACQDVPLKYCPSDNVSEAQMAVFVVRSVMGGDNFTYTTTPYFTDVPATNLYFPWIQKMQDLGIALPCAANRYCPDTPVTRGIMAVLIIRGRYGVATPSSYPTTAYFTDVTTSHPYFPWIQKMKQFGITTGCTATTYCPDDPVTRGQMAVFIMRGGFNLLLPVTTPTVVWASPASASAGKTVTATIIGQNTNFVTGVTQVNAGAGIAVSGISVVNGTTLTVQFTVAAGATPGPRSITVTTGSEEATLPNGFQVQQ